MLTNLFSLIVAQTIYGGLLSRKTLDIYTPRPIGETESFLFKKDKKLYEITLYSVFKSSVCQINKYCNNG